MDLAKNEKLEGKGFREFGQTMTHPVSHGSCLKPLYCGAAHSTEGGIVLCGPDVAGSLQAAVDLSPERGAEKDALTQ